MLVGRRLSAIALLCCSVTACGGGGGSAGFGAASVLPGGGASPTPGPNTGPGPTASPAPTSNPSGNVVWEAGSSSLGKWMVANTEQCGSPVQTGSTFTFNLQRSGTSCGRNQMLPLDRSGSLERVSEGQSYTFSFHYVDGTPHGAAPGMGEDTGVASALIFQIHPMSAPGGSGDLGLRLNFISNTNDIGNGNEHWGIYGPDCTGNRIMWYGAYNPGESDDWKIQLAPASSTSGGLTRVYRNGQLVLQYSGANMCSPSRDGGDPWWNMGPYKWRWELPGGGGSSMTVVNATIENMTETSP